MSLKVAYFGLYPEKVEIFPGTRQGIIFGQFDKLRLGLKLFSELGKKQ